MSAVLPVARVSPVAILAAALELQRIHGTEFAVRFLEPYQFDPEVVTTLLYPATRKDSGECISARSTS